jgi:hypothetical protein
MEEEERAAQSAKLQELIRRGRPQDLQEANRLMKVMAGYDTRHKTDYRAKAAEEVAKVQQKARLLEEMLQNHRDGDKIGEGDVFEVRCAEARQQVILLKSHRNLHRPSPARILRSNECVKKSRTIKKPWPSYLRSTTASIER